LVESVDEVDEDGEEAGEASEPRLVLVDALWWCFVRLLADAGL